MNFMMMMLKYYNFLIIDAHCKHERLIQLAHQEGPRLDSQLWTFQAGSLHVLWLPNYSPKTSKLGVTPLLDIDVNVSVCIY